MAVVRPAVLPKPKTRALLPGRAGSAATAAVVTPVACAATLGLGFAAWGIPAPFFFFSSTAPLSPGGSEPVPLAVPFPLRAAASS